MLNTCYAFCPWILITPQCSYYYYAYAKMKRVGLWRKLSTEEFMLLNCGVGEDSWESLQGDPTSPFWRRSALGFLWREWCWSWKSSTLATSCEELTHWKRLWCWEGLGAGGEGDNRGWDGWMASPTQWMRVWVNSGSWWWTGRPGVLRFMGSQRVGHDRVTELNWTEDEEIESLVLGDMATQVFLTPEPTFISIMLHCPIKFSGEWLYGNIRAIKAGSRLQFIFPFLSWSKVQKIKSFFFFCGKKISIKNDKTWE